MRISNSWLMKNRSKAGGWTYAQFAVLGVSTPPESGWKQQLVGREISDETARAFVEAASTRRPNKKHRRPSPQQLATVTIQNVEGSLREILTDRRGLFIKDGEFCIVDRDGPLGFGDTLMQVASESMAPPDF